MNGSESTALSGTSTAGATAAGRLVVLIEDNVDAAEAVALILQLFGHRVHVAHDGSSGLDLARKVRPDAWSATSVCPA